MAKQTIVSIYDHVYPYLPKRAPKSIVLQVTRRVFREFFRKTQAWWYVLPKMDIVDGQDEYEIDSDVEDTEIEAVMWVKYDSSELDPDDDYDVDADKKIITLEWEPDTDISEGLEVQVALVPTMTATEIEERLYNDYHEHLAQGILAELLSQPSKPWADKVAAAEYYERYVAGIGRAINERMRGRMNRTIYMKPKLPW